MSNPSMNPYASLNKIFHEPNRLAIISCLCASPNGLSFNEVKKQCKLTDGNLSRHLKTLEEARAVIIRKSFSGSKPQTTAILSTLGRESFLEYLKTLEAVLLKAVEAVTHEERQQTFPNRWRDSLGLHHKLVKN